MSISEHEAGTSGTAMSMELPEAMTLYSSKSLCSAHAPRYKRKRSSGESRNYLGESPGIRPEDVFVNILEAAKENWSVGLGRAQFA
jgi:4-oxalocrotonate tautomerase